MSVFLQGETGPAAGTNEGVLANFFNSLLSKKTAGSPGKPRKQTNLLPLEKQDTSLPQKRRKMYNRSLICGEIVSSCQGISL